ncbi:hypothetical protein Q8A73_019198 [Channa argus]|nr:hypothetical protein Q8A73_019198 [Channa argus]
MAFANQGRSIPWVGLRRTLRFQWRSSDREVMPRDLFCTRIIKGQLNLTVEDVFCIQWHQQATGYDVSFVSAETHQAVTARFLDWLSTVPGSAAPKCSRFCCTQMLKVWKGFSTPPAFPCRGHQSRRQCEGDPGSRGRGPTGPIKILGVQFQPMNSATVNWEGRFQPLKSRLALWKARKLTLLGKVLVLKADMLSSVLHLAYVFPLPVAIRRPLARTIFDFLWGGRYEWVARGRMMSGLAEGGRDVPDLPL